MSEFFGVRYVTYEESKSYESKFSILPFFPLLTPSTPVLPH